MLPVVVIAAPFLFESLTNCLDDEGNEFGKRDILIAAAIGIIEDFPLTGVGVGHGPLELPHYVDWLISERDNMPAHNPILAVGVDIGVPGILLYVTALLTAAWKFWSSRRRWTNAPMNAYFPIVSSCLVGYFLAWIKGGGMESDPTFFLALSLLLIPTQLMPETVEESERSRHDRRKRDRWFRVAKTIAEVARTGPPSRSTGLGS